MKRKIYRHRVRGTFYRIIGEGRFNTAAIPELDERRTIVYSAIGSDEIEVRFKDEFFDGRFEELPPGWFAVPFEPGPFTGRLVHFHDTYPLPQTPARRIANAFGSSRDGDWLEFETTREAGMFRSYIAALKAQPATYPGHGEFGPRRILYAAMVYGSFAWDRALELALQSASPVEEPEETVLKRAETLIWLLDLWKRDLERRGLC